MKKGNSGLGGIVAKFSVDPTHSMHLGDYTGRLSRILAIRDIEFHTEEVTGVDKTIDEVVDIFNKVNSGGTKLSKGDLALARICAGWQEARDTMKKAVAKWHAAGYVFDLDWLLRNMNAIITGEARFHFLHSISPDLIKDGLTRAEKSIDRVLNLIADRLGLDHDQVLFGRGAIPLLSHYVDRRGSALRNSKEQDRLLFWYLEAAIRGRYSGSTETSLDRDLSMVAEMEGSLDRLVSELSLTYGNLRILPEHFSGWSLGARFYPVLYMLTRVGGARDWGSGVALKRGLIGKMASLEVHHIFPKARLYASGKKYTRPEVNAVANFCFLTKDSNLTISDRHPEEYLAEVEKNYPGALASQWIPMDSKLWRIENYRDFLEERKRLLADAANHLLEELYHAPLPQHVGAAQGPIISPATTTVPGSILDPEEEAVLEAVNEWVVARGLPYGSLSYELGDQETGIPVAVLDLAWPSGLQQGLSKPVALLMNESAETVLAVKSRDFLVFTGSDQLKSYVEREVLAG